MGVGPIRGGGRSGPKGVKGAGKAGGKGAVGKASGKSFGKTDAVESLVGVSGAPPRPRPHAGWSLES